MGVGAVKFMSVEKTSQEKFYPKTIALFFPEGPKELAQRQLPQKGIIEFTGALGCGNI